MLVVQKDAIESLSEIYVPILYPPFSRHGPRVYTDRGNSGLISHPNLASRTLHIFGVSFSCKCKIRPGTGVAVLLCFNRRPFYTAKPVRSLLGMPSNFSVLSQVACVKPRG